MILALVLCNHDILKWGIVILLPLVRFKIDLCWKRVWEPCHSLQVTVDSKDDKAGIDLSLWAFVGETAEMEIAIFTVRNFLLQCWKRRLYLEAIHWLKNQYPIDYGINVAALYDALMRAVNYSWWGWLYGIRLFFWRWPYIWMKESIDGARAFHIYFPPPKLRFYSPPIKEERIWQLDIEKLFSLIRKRYLESGRGCTKVTITCHTVSKTLTDIRVVWNFTGNSINPSIYNRLSYHPICKLFGTTISMSSMAVVVCRDGST